MLKLGHIQRAVLAVANAEGEVRVTDIAKRIGTSAPAVSHALRNLERRGMLRQPSGWRLTPSGRRVALGLEAESAAP